MKSKRPKRTKLVRSGYKDDNIQGKGYRSSGGLFIYEFLIIYHRNAPNA
jgi:hypothetical protein